MIPPILCTQSHTLSFYPHGDLTNTKPLKGHGGEFFSDLLLLLPVIHLHSLSKVAQRTNSLPRSLGGSVPVRTDICHPLEIRGNEKFISRKQKSSSEKPHHYDP